MPHKGVDVSLGEDPKTWPVPAGPWPSGFDPREELTMLCAFSDRLLEIDSSFGVALVVTEPGYMHVRLDRDRDPVAELLLTTDSEDGLQWRYLYLLSNIRDGLSEHEFEKADIEQGVAAVRRWATAS